MFIHLDERISMYVNRKNAVSLCLMGCELVILFLSFGMAGSRHIESAAGFVGWLAITAGILSSAAVFQICREINCFWIFVVLSYLFSFGQCILAAFRVYGERNSAFSIDNGYFTARVIIGSGYLSLFCIALICIGYCLSAEKQESHENRAFHTADEQSFASLGWILFGISLIPALYCLAQDIVITMREGYGASVSAGYSGIGKVFALISGLFITALIILYTFERKHRLVVYFISVCYFGLQMMGGSRITVFRLCVIYLVITVLYHKTMTRKRWILLIVGILLLAFVFSLVSAVRIYLNSTSNTVGLINGMAKNVLKNNFLVSALREMGNTQLINLLVYQFCPSKVPFAHGYSYFRMLYSALPNVLGLPYDDMDTVFSALYPLTESGLGGSFIGELYWNLGWISMPASVLIGWIAGILTNRMKKLCSSRGSDSVHLFLTTYIFYFCVFMVRSSVWEFGRNFIYYALIPAVVYQFVERKENRTEENKAESEELAVIE